MSDTLSPTTVSDSNAPSSLTINGSGVGSALMRLLVAADIEPGDAPSYELCKIIYLYHPLGAKMAEAPINMAQSQQRDISVGGAPDDVKEAFITEWRALMADKIIHNTMKLARTYGISTLVVGVRGEDQSQPLNLESLARSEIYFSTLDPLNTSGSLVLDQDPNSPTFQKHTSVSSQGVTYHRSRICVMMNEEPIYIAYTSSAFGFVGRSVYQRALYPLKTFVQSMITDDMVTRKAGLLIYKMATPGSVLDRMMMGFAALKRIVLRQGQTNNVVTIGTEEDIKTLDMVNVDGAAGFARENVLKNIATSADMPAALLRNEEMVQGFAEGEEDAKNIARYIDRVREEMGPLYEFMTKIVMRRAWNKEFFRMMQDTYPKQYGQMSYRRAFREWEKAFAAEWPSLLIEPESKQIDVEDVKLKALAAILQVMLPEMDPENKVKVMDWAAQNIGENKLLFPHPLLLDIDTLRDYGEKMQEEGAQLQGKGGDPELKEPKPAKPFAATDAQEPTRLHQRLVEEALKRRNKRA